MAVFIGFTFLFVLSVSPPPCILRAGRTLGGVARPHADGQPISLVYCDVSQLARPQNFFMRPANATAKLPLIFIIELKHSM